MSKSYEYVILLCYEIKSRNVDFLNHNWDKKLES